MVAWPIRDEQPLSPLWPTRPPSSLSFSPISAMIKPCFPPRFLPPSFRWRPTSATRKGSRHCFWQISVSSDLLSRWDHLFWNEHSTIYKSIPPLPFKSSSLRSQLLFTSCLSRLFTVNQDSFVRWDPPKLDVLFISFRLIYIGYVLRTFRNHALRDWIVNLSVVSICM